MNANRTVPRYNEKSFRMSDGKSRLRPCQLLCPEETLFLLLAAGLPLNRPRTMASPEPQLTPMMAQYRRIKGELPKDALLLFRLGDFYEMFFEDAQIGAQLLNVALTRRGVIPMCGMPFHAANGYIARILKAGRKVAICDQMEDARPGFENAGD